MARRREPIPPPAARRCWMANLEHARLLHGENSPEYLSALDRPSTCLEPRGHAGEHRWTFDGDVTIEFS
jgi:hypothetical protein